MQSTTGCPILAALFLLAARVGEQNRARGVPEAEAWKWSSYRHYALREKGIVEIESEWAARDREQPSGRTFLRPE